MADTRVSRRTLVAGGVCGCMLCATGVGAQQIDPMTLIPLVTRGYRPVDADEKGLWQYWDRFEQDFKGSSRLMNAPGLSACVQGAMHRLMGDQVADVRVYLVHDAEFNASMTPNGMMIVHSGLLARARDEDQLAAVLGHECGHYLRRHSVQRWRDDKMKRGIMSFVSAGANIGAGVAARYGTDSRSWIDMANNINEGLALSIFSFSRVQESEADLYGLKMLREADYRPNAASEVWAQFIEERQQSAALRHKKYRDSNLSVVSTHPPKADRMLGLATIARQMPPLATSTHINTAQARASWKRMIAPMRATLLEEQVKLNDPGGSMALIESQARDGWDGTLRYYEGEVYRLRGEPGDSALASQAYASAVAFTDAPPEAWRAHGYASLKAGRGEDGRRALNRYLELAPQASDASMVRFSLAQ